MRSIATAIFSFLIVTCAFGRVEAIANDVVFVAGATGRTGLEIVKRLSTDGYAVIAMARDLSKVIEQLPNVQWVEGDVRDVDSLRRGMAGATYVVSAIGSTTTTGPNAPEFVDFAGTRNLADIAKDIGAKQFVMIASGRSGSYTDHSTRSALGYGRYYKTKGEEYVKASGLAFTILGAAGLVQKPKAPMGVRFLSRAEYAATTTSTDEAVIIAIPDVAAIVCAALKDPHARYKAFAIINDPKRPVDAWKNEFALTQSQWP